MRHTLLLLMAAALSCHAAEKIGWDDLRQRLSYVTNHKIEVTTRDGHRFGSRWIAVNRDSLEIAGSGWVERGGKRVHGMRIAREDVARVSIGNQGRYIRQVGGTFHEFGTMLSWIADQPAPGVLAAPFFVAWTAVAVPVQLTAEGVATFVPARVFDVAP